MREGGAANPRAVVELFRVDGGYRWGVGVFLVRSDIPFLLGKASVVAK